VATVVLVRHAEKAAAPEQDPPLTDAGVARARALLEALGDAGVAAIYSTDYARTRDTAQPLADATGVPVSVIADARSFVDRVAQQVRTRHAGDVVVVVGHSNTIGATIEALGGTSPGDLPDDAYDRFYIALVQEGVPTRVIRARFGAPSP
jgi:broad specificity phosphatase PhoE